MKELTATEKQTAAQLKAKIWYAVAKIVEETGLPVTPQFVAALAELTYSQALQLGEDLELFARHADRKVVQPEDIMMTARRNADLKGLLEDYWSELQDQ